MDDERVPCSCQEVSWSFFGVTVATFWGGLIALVATLSLFEIGNSDIFSWILAAVFMLMVGSVVMRDLQRRAKGRDASAITVPGMAAVFLLLVAAASAVGLAPSNHRYFSFPLRVGMFTIVGWAITMALTLTVIDSVNYIADQMFSEVAFVGNKRFHTRRPFMAIPSRFMAAHVCMACVLGAFYGLLFAILRVDSHKAGVTDRLVADLMWTVPVGAVLAFVLALMNVNGGRTQRLQASGRLESFQEYREETA